ncbi:MAG: DUF3048 domain-containing protein [Anaerolineae bacterium]
MKQMQTIRAFSRTVFLVISLFPILAAGCGSDSTPAPADAEPDDLQIQVSAPEPTPVLPTNTAPPTETAPPPTETPLPTATPVPPTATPEPTNTPAPIADAVVNVDLLNFRAGPGTNYDVLGLLNLGDPLTVTGKNPEGNWLAVSAADGTEGWVFADLTNLNIDLGVVAVAENIPPTPTTAPTQVVQAPPRSSNPPPAMPPPLPAGAVPGINPLTGLPTDKAALARRPVIVRVGNDPVARSIQAGLSQADVVYEEIMDGWGVTRYSAIFWSQDAPKVRPVRSARLISIDLAKQYQGALAHSGASDPIRLRISQAPIIDLDEFYNPPPYTYGPGDWRTRLYTTLPRLRAYLQAKGLDQPVGLETWAFSDQPPGGAPASTVTISYPNGTVVWQWDAGIGRYRRFIGGAPDIDANTGQQITAANVILLYAVHGKTDIVEDSLGSTAIDIQLRGSGQVRVVRDGVVIDGSWQRTNDFQPTRFSVPLKPGNSWVELIPANPDIRKTYQVDPMFQNQ